MLMVILALVVLGLRAYGEMPIQRYPDIDFPFVSIVVPFVGASPEDVEDLVLKPIEDAVTGISGVDNVTSSANEGVGIVFVEFLEGVDGNQAAIDVQQEIAAIRGDLPDDADEPTIFKVDINAIPILEIVLTGPQTQAELYELADDNIKPRLQSVSGVAAVEVMGGQQREVQVEVDPAKLAAYDMPLGLVTMGLGAENLTFPVGSVEEGRQKTSFRSEGKFNSVEDIQNLVIMQGRGGPVYVRDVATVSETFKEQEQLFRYNGLSTVGISLVKTTDANTIETADDVVKMLERLEEDLPPGVEITVAVDDSAFVRDSVNAVLEDLVLAVIIVGIVMLIFLHLLTSTIIVLLAIPTSLISTFLVMWILGYSINVLTLLALTLTIGILVDDSIVVLENIERHLRMGKDSKTAAMDGRAEIGLAAVAITLTDVVVYVPVAFTSGIVGMFFRSYGITIATATLFSLFVSFTLTPMLASLWLKEEETDWTEAEYKGIWKAVMVPFKLIGKVWGRFIYWWEWGFEGLSNIYARLLGWCLKAWWTEAVVIIMSVSALVLGVWMIPLVGTEFFPQEDDNKVGISITMPPGTTLETTDDVARQVEQIVLDNVPEAVSVLTTIGGGQGFGIGGGDTSQADITLTLVDKTLREASTQDVVDRLRPIVSEIPEANISLSLSSGISMGGAGAVQVEISGPDPDTLITLADEVEQVMLNTPGTVDVQNLDAVRSPEVSAVLDRDRVSDLGLSSAEVATTLRTALAGSTVGKLKREGEVDIDILVQLDEASRSDISRLMQVPLTYQDGEPIRLEQIAEIKRDMAPATINRKNRQRYLTITSNVEGRPSGDVANDIEAALNSQVEFPPDYSFNMGGATEAQRETFSDLLSAMALSIILIYMLLVALYQSFTHPLAILFSLPVAVFGAIGGLMFVGSSLNMISLLGMILLIGVVIKNAILIVDFTNILRDRGLSRKEALVEAGRLRLRPIIMTSTAIISAMMPLVFAVGAGAEIRQPLAAAVAGGSFTSMLLTLVLVPVVYTYLDSVGSAIKAVFRFFSPNRSEEGERKPAAQPGGAVGD